MKCYRLQLEIKLLYSAYGFEVDISNGCPIINVVPGQLYVPGMRFLMAVNRAASLFSSQTWQKNGRLICFRLKGKLG